MRTRLRYSKLKTREEKECLTASERTAQAKGRQQPVP